MFLDRPTLRTIAGLGLLPREAQSTEQAFPRASAPHLATVYGLLGTMWPIVRGAQALDDVFYRQYREQPVKEPVLVYATARSGTTLLHHLMSLDAERFAPMKMHHAVFPSVTLQRFIGAGKHVDQRLFRGAIEKTINATDSFFFKAWEGVHTTGINRLEEDESLFAYTLLTPGLFLVSPFMKEHERVAWMDELDEPTKQRLMAHYISCVKRHLYSAGGERTLLNKSTWFPGRIASQLDMFPDTRFIYLVRNPLDTIPSFVNFFYQAWKVFYPNLEPVSPQTRGIAELALQYYRRAYDMRNAIPKGQQIVVRFPDLVANPKKTVAKVYEAYGWNFSRSLERSIDDTLRGVQHFRSKKRYTLEDFGLSAREVYEPLADIFEAYNFEPPARTSYVRELRPVGRAQAV